MEEPDSNLMSSAMNGQDAGADARRKIFSVGDLIWVKLGKYPFWPCMVSYDPIQGDCIRLDRAKNEHIYHVQFFGEAAQRGWTVAGNIFEFKGESAYFERVQNLFVANASRGAKYLKRLKARYTIPVSSRKKWSIAVEEAEEAAKIPNLLERFRDYVFDYEKLKSKISSKDAKDKQKSSATSGEVIGQKNSVSNDAKDKQKSSATSDEKVKPGSSTSDGEAVKKRNSVSTGVKIKPTSYVSRGLKRKSSLSAGEGFKLRSSVSSGEGVKLRTSVLNGEKVKRKSSPLNVVEKKAKQRNSVSTDEKGEPKRSISTGTVNGSCPTFDKSAHCSKRIRLTDDSSQVCDVCDKGNSDLACTGPCGKFFHMECLGITNIPDNFKCAKCSSDISAGNSCSFSCYACKIYSGTLKECSNSKCTKYYHAECLEQYECANKDKNVCPLHTCLTCFRENPRNSMSNKGNMVQCMKCPTAFHSRESCIAAGSVEKSTSVIICSLHFGEIHKQSGLKLSNANYCAVCYSGGELVCCETCPNAYHENCLESDIPNEDFICDDCRKRRYLFYDMVVFAKSGKFSWWPGQIVHESHLSDSVKKAKKCDGQFAVYFFGTHNYSWMHGGRVYPYGEEHTKMKLRSKDKRFKLGLQEAIAAFEEYQKNRLTDSLLYKRPEAYRHIQISRALPPAQIFSNLSNISKCSCDPTKENPCGPESQCLNRSMLMECHADFCLAKDLCQNQKFQKRQYVPTRLVNTIDRGWGLISLQDVKRGEFIIEYVGEIITHEEYRRRSVQMLISGNSNYYFLYLDSRRMIDAGPMGNYSRFINHSCDPNCEMRKWSVNGDSRIGIFAIIDISTGEELTFNYQSDKYEFEQRCLCYSQNCRGFIGRTTNNHLKPAGIASKPSTSRAVPENIPVSNNEAQSRKRRSEKSCYSQHYKNFSISPLCSASSSSSTNDCSSSCCSGISSDYTSGISSESHSGSSPSTSSSTSTDSSSTTGDSSSSTGASSSTATSSYSSDISMPSTSGSSQQSDGHRTALSVQGKAQIGANCNATCSACRIITAERPLVCSLSGCLKRYHLSCVKLPNLPIGQWICPKHPSCCCGRDPDSYCFWCLMGLCTKCVSRALPRYWKPPVLECIPCEISCQCFKFIDSFTHWIGLRRRLADNVDSDDDDEVQVVAVIPVGSRSAFRKQNASNALKLDQQLSAQTTTSDQSTKSTQTTTSDKH